MVWKRVLNVAPYLEGKSESEQEAFLEGLRLGRHAWGSAEGEQDGARDGI